MYIYIVASFSGVDECFDLRAYVSANRPGSVGQTRDDLPVQVWLRSSVRYTGGTWDMCRPEGEGRSGGVKVERI